MRKKAQLLGMLAMTAAMNIPLESGDFHERKGSNAVIKSELTKKQKKAREASKRAKQARKLHR